MRWLAAVLCMCAAGCAPGAPPVAVGELAVSDAETPAGLAGASWRPVRLPHRLDEEEPPLSGNVWYRFAIPERAASEGGLAVYLPRLRMNAAVYVGDVWIGDGGPFAPHVAQNWCRPLYFELAPDLLDDPSEQVYVRLYSFPHDHGGLGRIYIGPHAALSPAHELQRTLEVDLARVVSFAILVVILLLVPLLLTGRFVEWRYLLLAACFLAIHSFTSQVGSLPVPYYPVRWALHFAIDGFTVSLAMFAHRWARLSRAKLEAGLWMGLLAGHLATALAPPERFFTLVTLTHAANVAVGVYTLATVVRALREAPPLEGRIGAGFGAVALAIGALSFAPYLGLLPPEAPRFIVLMGPAMLLGLVATLATRHVLATRQAELNQRELEARVEAREAELKREFARVQQLEAGRAVDAERERLMREMHDGMGGQLVGMLDLVERGEPDAAQLREALQLTLDDMRMVIDSLDPDVDDLTTLLGMMRVRLGRRIEAAGVTLDWKVRDVPRLAWVGRAELSHVQRIVQEAITNALRHARASTVTVETGGRDGGAFVRVSDDGVGLPDEPSLGRGLRNMRHRAERIGASLVIRRTRDGTEVELVLPAQSSSSSPS